MFVTTGLICEQKRIGMTGLHMENQQPGMKPHFFPPQFKTETIHWVSMLGGEAGDT